MSCPMRAPFCTAAESTAGSTGGSDHFHHVAMAARAASAIKAKAAGLAPPMPQAKLTSLFARPTPVQPTPVQPTTVHATLSPASQTPDATPIAAALPLPVATAMPTPHPGTAVATGSERARCICSEGALRRETRPGEPWGGLAFATTSRGFKGVWGAPASSEWNLSFFSASWLRSSVVSVLISLGQGAKERALCTACGHATVKIGKGPV